jgi:hypothetical protein
LLPKFSKLKPPSSQNGNATTTTGAPSVSPPPQSSQKHGHLNNTLIVAAGKLSKCNAAETRTHTKLLAAAVELLQVCRSTSESIKTKTPFFHVPPQVPQAQNKNVEASDSESLTGRNRTHAHKTGDFAL